MKTILLVEDRAELREMLVKALERMGYEVAPTAGVEDARTQLARRRFSGVLTDLKLPAPGTSADMEFTVRTVRCVGCCGLAPVVRVNDSTHPAMTQAKVKGMLKKYYSKPAVKAEAAQ